MNKPIIDGYFGLKQETLEMAKEIRKYFAEANAGNKCEKSSLRVANKVGNLRKKIKK